MTVAAGLEHLIIGEQQFALTEQLTNPTPELTAKHSGKLVVARRIDTNGDLALMREPQSLVPFHRMSADETLKHLAECKEPVPMKLIPPAIGALRPFNNSCFAIDQLENGPTALVPYSSERFPYLTHFAMIVE